MKNKIFTIIFALILALISIGTILLPKKDFSDNENRVLATFPEFSWASLKDGTFTSGISDYFTDHMIFRDGWVTIKTSVEKLVGKHESGGIQVLKNGMLTQSFTQVDLEGALEKISCFSEFETLLKEKSGIDAVTIVSPTATQIYEDLTYADCNNANTEEFFTRANAEIKGFIDLNEVLTEHRDEELFYRTDHHWTYLGAYYAYVEYCKVAGFDALTLEELDIETVTDEFFGTTYSRYGFFDGKNPDTVKTVSADKLKNTVVTLKGETHSGIFYPEKLEGKDKYLYFLGGNEAITEVDTGLSTGRTLVLVKDSYANSLLPYLCFHFDKIILIDLRYYPRDVYSCVEQYGATDVLVMYNLGSINESQAELLPLE